MSTNVSKNNDYSIGQVVYILSSKGQSIVPAMIVQRSTVETIEGDNVSWKLAVGPKESANNKPQRIVDLDKVNGELYTSLDDIRVVLENRLSGFIQKLVTDAQKRTKVWYGKQVDLSAPKKEKAEKKTVTKETPIQKNDSFDPEEFLYDDLEQQEVHQQQQQSNNADQEINNVSEMPEEVQKENLKQRLRQMVAAEDEPETAQENSSEFIETPDGKRIPINMKV